MLDIRDIRKHSDVYADRLSRKGAGAALDELVAQDARRRDSSFEPMHFGIPRVRPRKACAQRTNRDLNLQNFGKI